MDNQFEPIIKNESFFNRYKKLIVYILIFVILVLFIIFAIILWPKNSDLYLDENTEED